MTYNGDPKATLQAAQMCKTWEANRARRDKEQAQEDLRISVAEFKSAIKNLIMSKKGALPDVRDWKEIKRQLDRLEALEVAATTKQERVNNVEERLDALNAALNAEREQNWKVYELAPETLDWEGDDAFYHVHVGSLSEQHTPLPKSEPVFVPPHESALTLAKRQIEEREKKWLPNFPLANGGVSAFEIDQRTGHVRGFDDRMIRNDHGKVKM